MDTTSYIRLLERWASACDLIRVSPKNGLSYYGTGECAHWPVQSNFNVFAALAVLGTAGDLDEKCAGMTRCDITARSLSLLRYGLTTHKGEANICTDGGQWGHFWISVLGLERMMHGVDALKDHLTADDKAMLKRVLVSEADWITDNHPVDAGIEYTHNKPESNIWNGTFLLRTALTYPDVPRREAYLEKAASFLLNGISIPSDASSEVPFRGKPLSAWHVGPNFTDAYSLNHHNYLNVGYMVICLSNIAMLHFDMKRKGIALPPEVYHHAEDLWRIVKGFTFPDGRLWRIGGDTRARYCYCQDYALPMWLLAADHFGDDIASFETGWQNIVAREMDSNGDGYFLSKRLASVQENSLFYYARLESDRAVTLSQAAFWRRHFSITAKKGGPSLSVSWNEPYHAAAAHRSELRAASWVWKGADGPAIQCVPTHRSDMAEWQNNLYGELRTAGKLVPKQRACSYAAFDGGFAACGELDWEETLPMGEGEGKYALARHSIAAAALPDARTMIVLEHAVMLKDAMLTEVKSLDLKMPNDIWNGGTRRYRGEDLYLTARGIPHCFETTPSASSWLSIDDEISLVRIYGGDAFTIFRPNERRIAICRPTKPTLGSLYADEICLRCAIGNAFYPEGTVLFDNGAAVITTSSADARRLSAQITPVRCDNTAVRAVHVTGIDGTEYIFAANFGGSSHTRISISGGALVNIVTGERTSTTDGGIDMDFPGTSSAVFRMERT